MGFTVEGIGQECVLGGMDDESAFAHVLADTQEAKKSNPALNGSLLPLHEGNGDGGGGYPDVN